MSQKKMKLLRRLVKGTPLTKVERDNMIKNYTEADHATKGAIGIVMSKLLGLSK